jgi:oligopeptide transport system substrate-binding protein
MAPTWHGRSARWAAGLAAGALLLTACGGGDSASPQPGEEGSSQEGGVFRFGITEPTAIDPYNSQESEGQQVTHKMFVGLTRVDDESQLQPGVATKWETNANCSQWTFNLQPGTTFSNGEVVTAESFSAGMTRAAKGSAASDVAYHMAGIAGFAELQGGTATTFSGLSAPDDNTLIVSMAEPDCEFDTKTTHTVMSPVPSTAGEADNAEYNDMPIGNGPFQMAEPWQHNTSITLVPNDAYSFEPKPTLERVEISILNPANSVELEYQGFQSGQFDWARMPTPQLSAAKERYEPEGKWIEQQTNGMNFLLPIDDAGPTGTLEARLAISYAIDRQAIIDSVLQGLYTESTTIVPPVFTDAYQQGLCESCAEHDPEQAKQYAEQAGLPSGSAIKLQYNTGAGHEEWVQAVGQQLQETLGWQVDLQGTPFTQFLDSQQDPGATGLFRFAWGADYPTPQNFLFPLLSTESINRDESGRVVGDNRSRYSNPEFDALLTEASATTDRAARIELLQQAEQVAMEDMALIPLWNRSAFRLFDSSKFSGGKLDFFEEVPLDRISLNSGSG